jgi:hypothetical protein
MKTSTNFQDLEKHINSVFKGMMKSRELTEAGKTASKAMGRYVLDEVAGGGASGYDYEQSGDFHNLLASEAKHGNVYSTPSKLTMGFAYIPEMNLGVEAKRNFQIQDHVVQMNGGRITKIRTFKLKQEEQMPKWIIAEFGSGEKKAKGRILKDFAITYTPRPDKDFLLGPSLSKVRGEGGGRKKGYFMISGKSLDKLQHQQAQRFFHRGVKPGRIFSRGLESSQEEVTQILHEGISKYLRNN